jgi:hypothetical protein
MAAFPLWRWNIASNPAVAQPLHHVRTDTHTIIFQQDAYVYETTWPYRKAINPQQPQTAVFGSAVRLAGYDLNVADQVDLVLYWQSLAPLDQDYDVFVHLRDASGAIVAQSDGQPLSGLAATSLWQPGDLIRDPLTIPLPEELASGAYELRLGLYLRQTGERLPVSDGPAENDALLLDTITRP